MTSYSSPAAAQRRRANFFAASAYVSQDHDGSYQHLRAELGEENTARLITNIGTLALSSGIETSGASLSDAVKRIIGSLTPAERSAIASGASPPPRVQALLDSELKAAQQQRQLQATAATTAEDGSQGNRNGLIPTALAAMDRDLRGRTARSSEYSDLRSDSISSANYSSSQYARTGLNYATFSDLRNQGFNGGQIMAAVNTTRALGIDTNTNAAPMARVQRDIPDAVPGLRTTRDNWAAVRAMEEEKKKALEAGNTAAAEALARRIDEGRKRAEEHDKREHDRVLRERPDRAPDHQHLQGEVRRSALGHEARPGARNDAAATDQAPRLTQTQISALKTEGQTIQSNAAGEPQVQQTITSLAAKFGPAPDAPLQPPTPQPTRHAAAETPAPPVPPTNQPADAPVKTAEVTPPVRPQVAAPRMASPSARS